MKPTHLLFLVALQILLFIPSVTAETEVLVGHNRLDNAFESEGIPAPAVDDAGAKAKIEILTGERDGNSADLGVLNDGKIPMGEDEPSANFFFSGSTRNGRLLIDLGRVLKVGSFASYSWHNRARSVQKFTLYASAETRDAPAAGQNPGDAGWTALASVDTSKLAPGQHSVVIRDDANVPLGSFRYLLMDVEKSPTERFFNDTFFSEIDVVEFGEPEPQRVKKAPKVIKEFTSKHGEFTYTLDATQAPDLVDWCSEELIPVLDEWYPKLIEMLPVDGIRPAPHVTFVLKTRESMPARIRGVPAYASGDTVVFNIDFIRKERKGEAIGAGIHEMVHVVQFAGIGKDGRRARRRPIPSWVTEGAADYIRWFLFEPESMGAEITKRNYSRAHFDSSYRITANFMKYVIENHEPDLMRKINESIHNGYRTDLWKEWTGFDVYTLDKKWKEMHRKRLGLDGT